MYAVVRPYITAGAAFVGTTVIAVAPIAPPPPEIHIVNQNARLAAASQFPGPIAAIANIPANEIAALQALADALAENGPLACYPSCPPNNFLGWEPGFDEDFMDALVGSLLPFPLIAQPIADNLNAILLAELPVNPAGCTAVPAPCPNPAALFSGWFTVPLSQLIASGELDPIAPIQGLIATLTTPSTIEPLPDIQTVITTAVDLAAGLAVFLLPSPDFIASLFSPSTYVQTAITAAKIVSAVATVTLARFIPGNFSQPSFTPTSPTSIPSLSPNPGQTLTINADQTNDVTGRTEDDAVDLAHVPAGDQSGTENGTDDLAGVHTRDEARAAQAHQGLQSPRTAVEEPASTTITPTHVTSDGNKVKPDRIGRNGTTSGGGLAGTVKSVTDQISSTISKVTKGSTGGGIDTGESNTGGTGGGGTGE